MSTILQFILLWKRGNRRLQYSIMSDHWTLSCQRANVEINKGYVSLYLVKQLQYMLTVYCTRWWIRQRFITVFVLIIDTTYSHHNITTDVCTSCIQTWWPSQGRCLVLEQGGGAFVPGGEIPFNEIKKYMQSCLSVGELSC